METTMNLYKNTFWWNPAAPTQVVEFLKVEMWAPVSAHESRERSLILVSSSLHWKQWVFIPLVPEAFPTRGGARAWSWPDHSLQLVTST